VLQRVHPDDSSAVEQLIERVRREKTEFDFHHRLLMPDGSVKYLRILRRRAELRIRPVRIPWEAVTDITESKRRNMPWARAKRLCA